MPSTESSTSAPSSALEQQGGRAPSGDSARRAVVATVVGMVVLVLVLVLAIFMAADEGSVLGWILAAISLAWVCLAGYVLMQVKDQFKKPEAPVAEFQDPMFLDKIGHSFRIVQVQNNEIKIQLEAGEDAQQDLLDRALDTIDYTSKNAMDMVAAEVRSRQESGRDAPANAAK